MIMKMGVPRLCPQLDEKEDNYFRYHVKNHKKKTRINSNIKIWSSLFISGLMIRTFTWNILIDDRVSNYNLTIVSDRKEQISCMQLKSLL